MTVSAGNSVAGTDAPSPSHIVIRLYNTFEVSRSELQRAQNSVDALLRDAGVEATWRVCRLAGKPVSESTVACDETLQSTEVIVRILGGGGGDRDRSLGFSYIDTSGGKSALSTAYASRIRALAARSGIDAAVLLGRVIAHEIAHLFLGVVDHSDEGLMRAHWTDHLMRRTAIDDWRLSAREARELQEAVLARARASEPASTTAALLSRSPLHR
jgi:hypothetical protein